MNGRLKSRCFPAFPVQAARCRATKILLESAGFRLTLNGRLNRLTGQIFKFVKFAGHCALTSNHAMMNLYLRASG